MTWCFNLPQLMAVVGSSAEAMGALALACLARFGRLATLLAAGSGVCAALGVALQLWRPGHGPEDIVGAVCVVAQVAGLVGYVWVVARWRRRQAAGVSR